MRKKINRRQSQRPMQLGLGATGKHRRRNGMLDHLSCVAAQSSPEPDIIDPPKRDTREGFAEDRNYRETPVTDPLGSNQNMNGQYNGGGIGLMGLDCHEIAVYLTSRSLGVECFQIFPSSMISKVPIFPFFYDK
jgi:hypothetical protein